LKWAFLFSKEGQAVYLRIFHFKSQILTVEDDEKPVQHISTQQDIGTVCGYTAHRREEVILDLVEI
jgi:hypothetical protein